MPLRSVAMITIALINTTQWHSRSEPHFYISHVPYPVCVPFSSEPSSSFYITKGSHFKPRFCIKTSLNSLHAQISFTTIATINPALLSIQTQPFVYQQRSSTRQTGTSQTLSSPAEHWRESPSSADIAHQSHHVLLYQPASGLPWKVRPSWW